MMNGGFGPGFGSFWGMGGPVGLLINVAILVGIVWLVVWVIQKTSGSTKQAASATSTPSTSQPLSAREILDLRYAQGELTQDEYQTRRNDIT